MPYPSVVQSILAQHTFACALVTRGAICDCYPPVVKPDLLAALAALAGGRGSAGTAQ